MSALKNAALDLAVAMVKIDSTPGAGTRDVASLAAERLERSGMATTMVDYRDGNTNVIATWGDEPGICLSGHLDTVTVDPREWTVDPLGGVVRDGRLYGRGSTDMKSGVAGVVAAAQEYVRSGGSKGFSVVLTAEEEIGCRGASAAAEARYLPPATALLVAEPTSNRVHLGHRGALWIDLWAQGRSCHASTPWLGVNAAMLMVDALRNVSDWSDGHPSGHPLLGSRTWNVGRIKGGTLRNVVPNICVAELDFRTPSTEDHRAVADALSTRLPPSVTLDVVLTLPPVLTDGSSTWVDAVARAVGAGGDGAPAVSQFFTDASVLTPAMGSIPTVICGPGSADQAHTVDEYCDIEELGAFTEGLFRLLSHG